MVRLRVVLAVVVSVGALAGCQKDTPEQELPCEYWKTADTSRVTVPENCREELPEQAPADESSTTTPAPGAVGY